MKAEYILVLVCIAVVPAIMSRDPHLPLATGKGSLVRSILIVCIPFWVWDVLATARGHWQFNEKYVLGIGLLGLPIEEWLFFPVLGFVAIFTWESTKYFMSRR
ncbi:MAG: lycopene cyclase domain-containing protein [Bacteroidota bacterium]|jgi:lycopene cyclase domain-containing protein